MTLRSVKEKRRRDGWYYLPETDPLVSVTEVLKMYGGSKVQALIRWGGALAAGNVLADPDTYDTSEKAVASIFAVRDQAADRGSTVHSLIEAVLLGNPPEIIPDHLQGRYQAFCRWRDAVRPRVIETEATVANLTHGYAGTTDLICEIGTQTMLVDIKTGKRIYPEAAIQLSAYRHAEVLLTKDPVPLRLPMPSVDATAVLLLDADGYEFKEVHADLKVFLALKTVWEYDKGV